MNKIILTTAITLCATAASAFQPVPWTPEQIAAAEAKTAPVTNIKEEFNRDCRRCAPDQVAKRNAYPAFRAKHDVCIGSVEYYGHDTDNVMWVYKQGEDGPNTAECEFENNTADGRQIMRVCGAIVDTDDKRECRIEGIFRKMPGKVRLELIKVNRVTLGVQPHYE